MYAQIKNPNHPATMKYVNAATHVFITTLRDADVDYTAELDEQHEEAVAYAVLGFVHNVLPLLQSPSYPLVVEIPVEDHPLRCTVMQSPMVTAKETIAGVTVMVEDKNGLILYRRVGGRSVVDMIDSLIQLETPPWVNMTGNFGQSMTAHQPNHQPWQPNMPMTQPHGFNPNMGPQGMSHGTADTGSGILPVPSGRFTEPGLVDEYLVNDHIKVKRFSDRNEIVLAIPEAGTTPFNDYLPEKQDTGTTAVLLGDKDGNPETFLYIDVPMFLDEKIVNDLKHHIRPLDLNEEYRDHLENTYGISINPMDAAGIDGALDLTSDLLQDDASVMPKYFWYITKA